MKRSLSLLLALGILVGCSSSPPVRLAGIGNTSWQLVKFQGGNGALLTPDDKAKYTVAFTNDGNLSVRFDCNRGRGNYEFLRDGKVELSPIATTMMLCEEPSLGDRFVKALDMVAIYFEQDGDFFMEAPLDSGTLRFRRAAGA